MRLELRALQRTVGITFVFVTHDQEEALTLSDRIAVMEAGRVLQVDTPTGLYETPHSRDVAAFIGTMNFFDGIVQDCGSDALVVDAKGLGQIRVDRGKGSHAKGDRVQLAIRPEKLSLSETKPEGVATAIRGTLENAAYLGERSHYYVSIDGSDVPVAVSSQNRDRSFDAAQQARPVWLSWAAEAVVVLKST
jgi:spermidine/putrescine transport system ATP-binding protein/putrescine transport system ATP-binding protein